ncbi:MAG: type II toxin-antitoxin system VapB family antitoxin [Leucobacter sp.]
MTITSIDIDPELLSDAKRLLGASSNREAVERALRYTVSKERQILAFERISKRSFSDEQLSAAKIDY